MLDDAPRTPQRLHGNHMTHYAAPDTVTRGLIAEAHVKIVAPVDRVWNALVDPEAIEQYMFGTSVVSKWKKGGPIVWKGVWKGKGYEDKGTIIELEPHHIIQYSHFSPLSGLPDTPENYHTVTVELSREENGTTLSLSQDGNPTEEARNHSQKNWETMLLSLKKLVEGPAGQPGQD